MAGAVALVTGCVASAGAQEVRDGYWPRWGIQLEEVHQAIMADVFDHRSAQYRGLALWPVKDGNVLCGWVTWRGDDGQYVSWAPFFYQATKGGSRDWLLGQPATTLDLPAAFEGAGCNVPVMRALYRGHRAL